MDLTPLLTPVKPSNLTPGGVYIIHPLLNDLLKTNKTEVILWTTEN
jgi:hypothetical protein